MIVITSGNKYLDIDGYASAICYRELLKLRGIDAKFVSYSELNGSVSQSLRNIPYAKDEYQVQENDEFIILDVSNPDYFPPFVKHDKIMEIIDHHPGFREYWQERLNDKAIIEEIGSVGTLIYEKYVKYHLEDKITEDLAKLMLSAILDNTICLKSPNTTEIDHKAYKHLIDIIGDKNYAEKYFLECQKDVENDLEKAIIDDIKTVNYKLVDDIGQLILWNAKDILKEKKRMLEVMNEHSKRWLLNITSLEENKSYILYSDRKILDYLKGDFNVKEIDDVYIVDKAIQRYHLIHTYK